MLLLVLDHDQGQLLLLEVQLRDLRPEEEPDLGFTLEDQDSRGSESQAEIEKTNSNQGYGYKCLATRLIRWAESRSSILLSPNFRR